MNWLCVLRKEEANLELIHLLFHYLVQLLWNKKQKLNIALNLVQTWLYSNDGY